MSAAEEMEVAENAANQEDEMESWSFGDEAQWAPIRQVQLIILAPVPLSLGMQTTSGSPRADAELLDPPT